jgi:hypothetical protein
MHEVEAFAHALGTTLPEQSAENTKNAYFVGG